MHYEIYIFVFGFIVATSVIAWRRFWALCEAAAEVDWGGIWINRVDGANRLFCRYYHRLRYDPILLPAQGPAILVANHISGLDPLLLLAAVNRPLRFLIAKEEYERFGFTWLFRAAGCIPVDRHKNAEQALRAAMVALKNGEVLAIFPHGGITELHHRPRKLKGGAVRLAQKTASVLYPVVVQGIRGKGHTLLALPLRSHAYLKTFEPMVCEKDGYDECMAHLSAILNLEN